MKDQLRHKQLILKKSTIHGYGVFTDEDIEKGEVIEECHTLVLENIDVILKNYVFKFGDKVGLALGFGSIYNHAKLTNASFVVDSDNQLIAFLAEKNIRKGQEILVSYGSKWLRDRHIPRRHPSKWRNWINPRVSFSLRMSMVYVIFFFMILAAIRYYKLF